MDNLSPNSIPVNQPQVTNPAIANLPKPKPPIYVYMISGLVLLTLVLGVLIYKGVIPKKSQDLLLASVEDRKIYLSGAQRRTEETLVKSAIDKKALQNTLDILIEEAILDTEAQRLNIQPTDEEITRKVSQQGNASPSAREQEQYKAIAKYQLLRDKITQKEVESREAYTISFWVPPYNYPDPLTDEEKAKFEKIRQDGKIAMDEAAELLKKGDNPLSITQHIFHKYPSIESRLALNGLIFKLANKDDHRFTKPELHIYIADPNKQSGFKEIFDMQLDEVRVVPYENGAGLYVAQIKAITNTGVHSYEDWLEGKKKELVKIYNKI